MPAAAICADVASGTGKKSLMRMRARRSPPTPASRTDVATSEPSLDVRRMRKGTCELYLMSMCDRLVSAPAARPALTLEAFPEPAANVIVAAFGAVTLIDAPPEEFHMSRLNMPFESGIAS